MDDCLRRVQGRKVPTSVLDVELSELARALTAVLRRTAGARVVRVGGARYVQISGRGVASLVPEVEWQKIMPSLRDESFSTQMFPVESAVRPLDSDLRLSVDARDPLYARVYGVLGLLFTTKVPTT